MAAPSVDDLARSFERYLRAGNKSPRTIETYLEAVVGFSGYLAATSKLALDQARREDVEAWMGALLARWRASTAHNRYRGLHAFYRWLEEEEDIPSPMAKMKPPAVPDVPIPILGEPQLRALFAVCAGKDFDARRDTALLMTLLDAGPRRAELLGMRLGDLKLRVRRGARGRQGRPGAGPAVRPQDRPGAGPLPPRPLAPPTRPPGRAVAWPARPAHHLGPAGQADRRARQAGIPALHPHMFRHTFAHEWLSAGGDQPPPGVASCQRCQISSSAPTWMAGANAARWPVMVLPSTTGPSTSPFGRSNGDHSSLQGAVLPSLFCQRCHARWAWVQRRPPGARRCSG
jgi:integrase